ncbi:MAG TPA: aminoacyl-tRNA hydrolase [Afifellaceae bacterium]|nr:aminoacyl-tRNA hydrolase [Afifellaceae bacterium]
MLLIVGLGNPGQRYAGHRHNIGFRAADAIHRRHGFPPWRARFQGEAAEGLLDGEKALILKPATFMNESGRAVAQAVRFYKLEPRDIVVIHDELDLPPGKLRMKAGGGHGGHNGLKSVEAHVGKAFRRMRLGIGHPGRKEQVNGYVLHDFAKADRDWLEPLLAAIADNAALLARGDDASLMNRVHLVMREAGAELGEPPPANGPVPSPAAREKPARGYGGALADGLRRLLGRGG